MSGIDEQIQGIPRCPTCEQEIDYWVLETTLNGRGDVGSMLPVIAWLFSDDYAIGAKEYYQGKHVGLGDKRFGVTITEFTADHITSAETTCRCRKRYRTGPTFNAVKRAVAYWLRKEGFGSERN